MSSRYRLLYKQPQLPVFQNRMYDTREEALACPTGDMELVQDLQTGLIFNRAFREELVVYDSAYQNEQGVSMLFQKHLHEVMGIIDRGMGRNNIVEVGCGKGLFLELLLANEFDITGFDPTYEGSNPRVKKHFFEQGVGIEARGLILRHVLEHIPNPVAFLKNLALANGQKGRIYIEVPCFDWICNHKTWFDIFHEHVNYFRLSDFDRIFGEVVESGRVFGGQYLYAVAEMASIRDPLLQNEKPLSFPDDFTAGIEKDYSTRQGEVVIWGGASKGVIFSLLRARSGYPVDTVIDINPSKQEKFLPVSGLQVRSPEDVVPGLSEGTPIFVMNSNYLDEIKTMTENKFSYITVDHE